MALTVRISASAVALVALLCALLMLARVEAVGVDCSPSAGMKREECEEKIPLCELAGTPMKFTGPGCKRKRGGRWSDGGCQCLQYCGYRCKDACNRDSHCRWNRNLDRCFNRYLGTPGGPISPCPVPITHGPTGSPSVTCFHVSSTVETISGAKVNIADIKYGDQVLAFDAQTLQPKYSPVVGFTGYFPGGKGQATHIHVAGAGKPLILSGTHLLLASADEKSAASFVQAQTVKPGYTVYYNAVASKVVKVTSSEEVGWVTPLTKEGTIVVDGVMASCHTIGPHSVVRAMYTPLQMYLDMFPRANGTAPDEFENNEHWYALGIRRTLIGKTISAALGMSLA